MTMQHTATGYRTVEHTGDIGIDVWAPDLEALFATASCALFEVMGHPSTAVACPAFQVVAHGVDLEDLLVRLLAELLVGFELEARVVERVEACHIAPTDDGWSVRVLAAGSVIDHDREGLMEIKAITYHQLEVSQGAEGWTARVIFDL